MTRLTRDLATSGAIVAGILVSLIIVRLTASGTAAPSAPAAEPTPPVAGVTFVPDKQDAPAATAPSTATAPAVASSTPPPAPPAAAMVLSSGVPVVPSENNP